MGPELPQGVASTLVASTHRYPKRKCEECGAAYWPKQVNQRRCSSICTDKYRSRRSSQRKVDRRTRGCQCGACDDCIKRIAYNAQQNEWYQKNRLRLKLAVKGMTVEQYEKMLEAQGGVCAICGREPGEGRANVLAPDHDHTCCKGSKACGKCVRGLLCLKCNVAIAMMADDPELLRKAAMYLKKKRKV